MLLKIHYNILMLKSMPCEPCLVEKYFYDIPLSWALAISYQTTSLASLTAKPVGP